MGQGLKVVAIFHHNQIHGKMGQALNLPHFDWRVLTCTLLFASLWHDMQPGSQPSLVKSFGMNCQL
jgi:hypothetical protein